MVIYLMTANVFIDDGMTLIRPLRKTEFYLHKMVNNPNEPAYESYSSIAKFFGVDGSSVRRLIMSYFDKQSKTHMQTRKQHR